MKLQVTAEEESTSPNLQSPISNHQFQFRPYQREDLARAACRDGAIIGWDPGLGKTMAMFALPFLKGSRHTLIVAPAGLHEQIIDEGRSKFHVDVTPIPDQETALRLIREGILPAPGSGSHSPHPSIPPSSSSASPRFFITAYNWLGFNGGDEWEAPATSTHAARLTDMSRHLGDADEFTAADLLRQWQSGIGKSVNGIKCVFAPTLASIVHSCFDCVVGDEAVRVKSGDAKQAEGVLRMVPRYRYLLTGTPIKNRLPDFFFLAAWVAGFTDSPSAIWPYGNTLSARDEFAKDFGVTEENETRTAADRARGIRRRHIRTTARICNVHRLWRILGPVIIRRSKSMIEGCGLVNKNIIPVHVMPGTAQAATYRFQLLNPERKKTPLATIGAQLQRLRTAALDPSSPNLIRDGLPLSRSHSPFTPKMAGILKIATDLMAKGEQLVVFSPFQSFSDNLLSILTAVGIPSICLDGNTSPVKRGSLVKQFRNGSFPVLIAGLDSMGEGHNLDNASHLVLPSLSWAFDSNTQAIERVHRLTSRKDVTIYVMVADNTLDVRLHNLWMEKSDSSGLALDGRLPDRDDGELDLGELLAQAVAAFDPKAPSLCEDAVKAQWETTGRPAAQAAYATYRRLRIGEPSLQAATQPKPKPQPERSPIPSPIQPPITNIQSPIINHAPQSHPVTLRIRRHKDRKPLAIPAGFF
jgi:hypothetical protein